MTLPVPHFKQEYPHTCVVACIRMVLAYLGQEHTALNFPTAAPGSTQWSLWVLRRSKSFAWTLRLK